MNYAGFAIAGAQLGLESLLLKPKRGLYDPSTQKEIIVVPQATVREVHHDEMEITDHPVEYGAEISDHAFKHPAELVIQCAWSNSPTGSGSLLNAGLGLAAAVSSGVQQVANVVEEVLGLIGVAGIITDSRSGQDQQRLNSIYDSLIKLQASRTLFDVYTGRRLYNNMLLKSVRVENDYKTENSLFATLTCRQLILVNTQTVVIDSSKMLDPAATNSPTPQGTKTLTPSVPNFVQPGY